MPHVEIRDARVLGDERRRHEEKRKGQKERGSWFKEKDVAGETPREANEKKIVEPSKEERWLYEME